MARKTKKTFTVVLLLLYTFLFTAQAQAAPVALNKKTVTLTVGQTAVLKLTGTSKKVAWSSSKPSVASVNSNGKITAKKTGTAKITAKVNGKKYTCTVTVKNKPAAKGRLNHVNVSLHGGYYIQLKVIGVAGTPRWSSANPAIAVVSKDGLVTAAKKGKTVISATVGGKTYRCTVTVLSNAAAPVYNNAQNNIRKQAPKADPSVLNAFEKLHFRLIYDSKAETTGLTDCKDQSITMKYQSDAIYHELGHFLAFITGNADYTSEWQNIYCAEKSKYTKFNKGYVCSNQYEYFAESYKEYILDRATLRTRRPRTYKYIVNTVKNANAKNAVPGYWEKTRQVWVSAGIWKR